MTRQQHQKVCMKDVIGTRIQAISRKVLYREAPPLGSNPYPYSETHKTMNA